MLTGTIHGTTFTGHPLRTTLGNTLRSYFYIRYAFRDIPQKNYRIKVSGDDTLVIANDDFKKKFKSSFNKCFLSEELDEERIIQYGLG